MIPAALAHAVAQADSAPLDRAIALIRPWLEDIGWFEALLEEGCRDLADDPLTQPALRASRSGGARHLVLARTERIWLTAIAIDPAALGAVPGRIHFSGRHALVRPLSGPLRGEGFRLEAARAIATGARCHAPGAVVAMDERHETLRLSPTPDRLLLLRAQVAPPGPVRSRVHDGATGRVLATAEADEGHARSLMLLSLLRMQGRADAAAQFAAALDAPLATQRWAVMREYLALDTAGALPALRAMARGDADAAVRDLAARTLTQAQASIQVSIPGRTMPCPA